MKNSSSEYPARQDLKQSLLGPHYQVLVALSIMLAALQKKQKFQLKLELDGVGALDDVVVSYFDKANNITETHLLQLKHSQNPDEMLTEGDLKNQSGKCEIFKYFDDWYLFVRNNPTFKNHKCFYYTNRTFNSAMLHSTHFQNTLDGYKFSNSFFQNNLYTSIKKLILKNSLLRNKNLVGIKKGKYSKKLVEKNPTHRGADEYYKKTGKELSEQEATTAIDMFLKNHYYMKTGQQHALDLEKTVKEHVSKQFPDYADSKDIFNALLNETWSWFRQTENTKIWDNDTLTNKLKEFEDRFKKYGDRTTRGIVKLESVLEACPKKIPRPKISQEIKKIIDGDAPITVIAGEDKVGKSTELAYYLLRESGLCFGSYFFFDSEKDFQEYCSCTTQENLSQLCIVDAAKNSDAIKTIWEQKKNNGRLIILSNYSISGIDTVTISLLSKEEIHSFLEKKELENNEIIIGDKKRTLKEIAESEVGGLYEQMRYPSRLIGLCEHRTTEKSEPNTKNTYTNTELTFTIPLSASKRIPLYTLEEIMRMEAFTGPKRIICEKDKSPALSQTVERAQWIDVPPLDDDKKYSTTDLENALGFDRTKNKFFILTDFNDILCWWPNERLEILSKISDIAIISENEKPLFNEHRFYLATDTRLKHQNKPSANIPPVSQEDIENIGPIKKSIKENKNKIECVVITAEGGSGKSTTLKSLLKEHNDSSELSWAGYQHLVYVPLNELAKSNCQNLTDIIKHFLLNKNENKVIAHSLIRDLEEKQILFLLDGWDETNHHEREKITELLEELKTYGHFMITTRPTALSQLFFKPKTIYELTNFDLDQQKDFLNNFFREHFQGDTSKRDRLIRTFTKEALKLLKQHTHIASIIGLPLQCYLLCESWLSAFEAHCHGTKTEKPWETMAEAKQTTLYESFVVSRLRKTLFDGYHVSRETALTNPEEICALGKSYLEALQQAAYLQLFREKQLVFGQDWFADQIERLGLIKNNDFIHKTYAEYFAALYIINLLVTNPNEARKTIFETRYQPQHRLVFKFIAEVVSHGSHIIPNTKSYLKEFWEALLQEPRDFIGEQEESLIKACLGNSKSALLEEILDGMQPEQEPTETSSQQEKMDATSKINKPKTIIPEKKSSRFQAQTIPFNWQDKPKMSAALLNIRSFPFEEYNAEDKKKCINWLLNRIQEKRESYLIRQVSAEKLEELSITLEKEEFLDLKNQAIKPLQNLFREQEHTSGKSAKKQKAFSALLALQGTNDLTENEIQEGLSFFAKENFSSQKKIWLEQQTLTDPQLETLLSTLENEDPSKQRCIINCLFSTYRETLLKRKKSSLSIWVDYEQLNLTKKDGEFLFKTITHLKYEDPETLKTISELIPLVRKLLNTGIIDEPRKEVWRKKLSELIIEASNKNEHKNLIPELIASLCELNPPQKQIDSILNPLLKNTGFWVNDAIYPSLPYLIPYFNETLSDYLCDQIDHSNHYRSVDNALSDVDMAELKDSAIQPMIETLIKIYSTFPKQKRATTDRYEWRKNPVFYTLTMEPKLVIKTVLNNFDENRAAFLTDYLQKSRYAAILKDNELTIDTSGDIIQRKISAEQSAQLRQITTANKKFKIKAVAHSRSPSPMEFTFAYGSLFSRKTQRNSGDKQPMPKRARIAAPSVSND